VIRSVEDDRALEAIPTQDKNNSKVKVAQYSNSPFQRWRVRKVDNNSNGNLYFIINVGNGHALDVEGNVSHNDTSVITWPFNGQKNQQWEIIPVAPGAKNIQAQGSW